MGGVIATIEIQLHNDPSAHETEGETDQSNPGVWPGRQV